MPSISQDDLIARTTGFGKEQKGFIEEDRVKPETSTEEAPERGILETAAAAFSSENIISSAVTRQLEAPDVPLVPSLREVDPNYNPFTQADLSGYQDNLDEFRHLNSAEEVAQMKRFIDRQQDNQRIIQEEGFAGTAAAMAGSVLDPTFFVPVAGIATKTAQVSKAAFAGATRAGGSAAGAVGVQEAGLQLTQTERAIEDSAINTIAAAAIGGVIGGAIGTMTTKQVARAQDEITSILTDTNTPFKISDGKVIVDDSAGAAKAMKPEQLARVNETLAKVLSGPEVLRPAALRALTSEFEGMQQFGDFFYEHAFTLNKHTKGFTAGPSAETQLKKNLGTLHSTFSKVDDELATYKGNLNRKQLRAEIAVAMRNADAHTIPQVANAAKMLRKEVDDLTTRLQKAGLLADDIELVGASSYFTRRYRQDLLATAEGKAEFIEILTRHFNKNKGFDLDAAKDQAEKSFDKIVGLGEEQIEVNRLSESMLSSKGPSKFNKERVLDVDDNDIAKFLHNDPFSVIGQYAAQANKMLAVDDMLKRMGADSIADFKAKLKADFETAANREPARRPQLVKKFKNDLDLFDTQMSLFLGARKRNKVLSNIRAFQTMQLLGGVLISSLPDIVNSVAEHGLKAVIRDGYAPLVRSLKTAKLEAKQLHDFGIAMETENDTILRILTDPDADYSTVSTGFTKAMDTAIHGFGKITGLSYWNNFHKRIGAKVSLARTIRALKAGTKMSSEERTRLARQGIGEQHFDTILQQFDKHGFEEGGSYILNLDRWDPNAKEAIESLQGSIFKDTDISGVLTPSRADLPLIVQQSEIARMMFQFKSFSSAATGKILLKGLDRRDTNTLTGITMMIGLGAGVEAIKAKQAGREVPEMDAKLLLKGISRSGLLGVMGDYTLGSLNTIYGGISSRYAGRNLMGLYGGPAVGLTQDIFNLIPKIMNPEKPLTEADKRKIYRMIPYQNLFWLRAMLEQINSKPKRSFEE